jgi:hypothetical protein
MKISAQIRTQTILPSYREITIDGLDRFVLISSLLLAFSLQSFLFKPKQSQVISRVGHAKRFKRLMSSRKYSL